MESPRPEPTEQDLRNAAMRLEIAERQQREWSHCQILALRLLGPGWQPSMKLTVFRVEDCGPTGKDDPTRVPAAVAYQVKRGEGEGRLVRFVRETNDGRLLASERFEDVYEGMLDEKHPTRTMEVKGVQVPTKRYQMYWSAMELYHPKSAEGLAALRATRERRKEEKLDAQFVEENPLFASIGMTRGDFEKAI